MACLLAEFEKGDHLVEAARALREKGVRRLDSWTPYPVEGLDEVIPNDAKAASYWVFGGGVTGGTLGFFIQLYCNAIDYPLNVGSRPLIAIPAWIPITFESTVLFAGFAGLFWVMKSARLLRLHHQVDTVPGFERATQDRYFLGIDMDDPKFDRAEAIEIVGKHHALRVIEAPNVDVSDEKPEVAGRIQ